MAPPEEKIGARFQQETKYLRPSPEQRGTEKIRGFSTSKIFPLPSPQTDSGVAFWAVLLARRSIRDYSPSSLSQQELANLLFATQGLTAQPSLAWFRTAPSAGALHPIDTYLIVNDVEKLESGIYFFNFQDFNLEQRSKGDYSLPIAQAALGQDIAQKAGVVFVWVAVIQRSRQKYRQRAYRYIYLDCGHIAQNLYLAATAMNLGCCAMAAFFDDEANALVGVDGREETAIYLASVGRRS